MEINGTTYTIYAFMDLHTRNKDSEKVLETLINAGYTIINRETESGKFLYYLVAKAEGEGKNDKAIKTLEQEPILDKIRAEVDSINLNEVAAKYEDRFYGFQQETLAILDKYRAETEADNGNNNH